MQWGRASPLDDTRQQVYWLPSDNDPVPASPLDDARQHVYWLPSDDDPVPAYLSTMQGSTSIGFHTLTLFFRQRLRALCCLLLTFRLASNQRRGSEGGIGGRLSTEAFQIDKSGVQRQSVKDPSIDMAGVGSHLATRGASSPGDTHHRLKL